MAAETKLAGPNRVLPAALLLVSGSTVFLDYWEYSREFHADPQIWESSLQGLSAAPQQYRIGVLKTAQWIAQHTHLAMRHTLALIDLVALLLAAFVLLAMLRRSRAWQNAGAAVQWLGGAALVGLLQYALLWLNWYQRPETLPTAALLALTVWLAGDAFRNKTFSAMAQIVLALLLGTIRPDAAVALHAGLLLVCLTPRREGLTLGRALQAVVSLLSIAAACGVQTYIMRVLYPAATYGSTPRYQLLMNLKEPFRILPFLLFVAPFLWVFAQWVRGRFKPDALQCGVLLGGIVFTAMWGVLGKIDEVRIFLPFSFLAAPVVAGMLMERVPEARPKA